MQSRTRAGSQCNGRLHCRGAQLSAALISNCATKTSTRDFCHSYSPRFVLSNKRSRIRPKGKQCPHPCDAALHTTPASEALANVGEATEACAGDRTDLKPSDVSVQVITV